MKISKYKRFVWLISGPRSGSRRESKSNAFFHSHRGENLIVYHYYYNMRRSTYIGTSLARKYSRAFLFVPSFFSQYLFFPFFNNFLSGFTNSILNFEESFIGLFYLKNYSILHIHISSFDLTFQWQKFME